MARIVSIDPIYNWNSQKYGPYTVHSIGREKTVQEFLSLIPESGPLDQKALKRSLAGLKGNFAVIMEAPDFTLAVVDKVRGYPVFYIKRDKNFCVSNSARLLKREFDLAEVDELSLLEFRMAGYVTGRETLYKNLYQLQAGEFLVWDKLQANLRRERYYIFYSNKVREEKKDDLIQELDGITNAIVQRNMEDAAGRPIWVPLSGGLDSRLILCKLKQLGYDNLHAFSYGLPGNFEAKAAGHVAEKLEIPWIFVPSRKKPFKNFFWSEQRKRYWAFSDGLCSVPNMQDLKTLKDLRENAKLPENAVLVNGQSGDFITGGHLPPVLSGEEAAWDQMTERLTAKHYSLWLDRKTPANLNRITEKVLKLVKEIEPDPESSKRKGLLYEYWEWQERQCKYVVNGQRTYDFFQLSWDLPLWQEEYLFFWESIPVPQKLGQELYRSYLSAFDFYGLFKNYAPNIWRWPGISIAVVPLAQLVGLVAGRRTKDLFYKYASYFGHYGDYFGAYGFRNFLMRIKHARGAMSFLVDTWIKENMTATGRG
ncbi:MAG: asparagine synthase-related protein [Thermodesulfobacteriota bacterium]|nr:asparagine synthase-related protein [Thermodesulfobacteriota bacterium]